MPSLLFVCHGNICRSPMAQSIFAELVRRAGLADRFLIDSAAVSTEEIGSCIYPPAGAFPVPRIRRVCFSPPMPPASTC